MARGNPVLCLCLVAACACGRTKVGSGFDSGSDSNDVAMLTVQPAHIVFPPTLVGTTSTMPIQLGNFDATDERVALATSPPFVVPPGVTVPGEGIAITGIDFTPMEVGRSTGTLSIVSPRNVELLVTLEGEGTSRCVSGCNDGDACTRDLCADPRGCFHEPVICPPATNPCETSECHAAYGCEFVPVPDGTPCGVSTCGGTTFCRAGQCSESGRPPLFALLRSGPLRSELRMGRQRLSDRFRALDRAA